MFEDVLLLLLLLLPPPPLPLPLEGRKCFIKDALNTFYLRLYGVRHMIEDHSDSERGNPLPQHGLLFFD